MKKRFRDEQIIAIIKEQEAGEKTTARELDWVIAEHGMAILKWAQETGTN